MVYAKIIIIFKVMIKLLNKTQIINLLEKAKLIYLKSYKIISEAMKWLNKKNLFYFILFIN